MIKTIIGFTVGVLLTGLYLTSVCNMLEQVPAPEPPTTSEETMYVGVNYGEQGGYARYVQQAKGYEVGGLFQRTENSIGIQGSWK